MNDRALRIRLVLGATLFVAVAIGAALLAGRLLIATELEASSVGLARGDLAPYLADLQSHPDEPPDPPAVGVQVGIRDAGGVWIVDGLPPDVRAAVEDNGPDVLRVTGGDHSWMVVGDRAQSSSGELHLWAARDLEVVDETLEAIDRTMVVGGLGLLVVFGVASWFFVRAALRPVEDARRRERRFISEAAHELRTPLAALRAQLEIVRRRATGAERELDEADASAMRLSDLASNLLELARLDEGSRAAWSDVAGLTDELLAVVDDLRTVAAARGIVIDCTAPTDPPPVAAGLDRISFARIVRNLVGNALAVLPDGGTVEVSLDTSDDLLVLVVADDGPGMPDSLLARALDRFTRGDEPGSGSGLGLALVDALARSAHGTVSIRNTSPGLRAEVGLPLRPSNT